MGDSSERDLIDALQRHEPCACDQLMQRYEQRVYDVALRLTHHPNEAEDVTQETFINACRHVDQFEGRAELGTWLHRIATNNGLMHLRRHEAPSVPLDGTVDETQFQVPYWEDWRSEPEAAALRAELQVAMREAIHTLPDNLRAAFVLRDLEGVSTHEAAERLGITPEALKVRLHRARQQLRTRLINYLTEVPYQEAN